MTMHDFTMKNTDGFNPMGFGGTSSGRPPMQPNTFRLVISGVGGCIIGVAISLIVNCTLLEISLNAFFATYFGLLFIGVGLIILWRIREQQGQSEDRKKQLTGFALLILVSGFMCFLLEEEWYLSLSRLIKVPLYSILGISVAFALTFSVIDLLNYVVGFVQDNNIARSIVESQSQIHLVLMVAMTMGALFGFIFGTMEVPHADRYRIKLELLRVEHYCFQIGAVLGGLGGAGNEYLRQREAEYSPVNIEFDEDI